MMALLHGLLEGILLLCWIGIVVIAWLAVCNRRTAKQRGEYLDVISEEAKRRITVGLPWEELYAMLKQVSYDRHLFLLAVFKDPLKRQPELLQRLVREDRDKG